MTFLNEPVPPTCFDEQCDNQDCGFFIDCICKEDPCWYDIL